ncbi:SIS domain-containing protein [Sessilibacter corallicola]|uniref:Transcriptional regulator HexR n=1 Tax=Sessilibacter corallicola TaxID=2904075 RepID=A0ABQ0ABS4_9GAMM|nr:SIS domain-containing protein [Sessilibacter corallicola]MCE2027942.1 SIS domain-containing protein [Sessilibacter corallicola]
MTLNPSEVTQNITDCIPTMRKSERKVAEYVLENTRDVIHMRIVDLANAAKVSEPTVVRFCRAVGCNGFQEFKLNLAQQLASIPNFVHVAVTRADTVTTFSQKIFDSTVETLLQIRDQLDPIQVESAIQVICKASRVEFFGFGASGAVAADAHHKFFRLQLATAAYSDHHIQHMSAMSMKPGDVVVAISQSGRTKSLLDSMDLVKQQGGIVIGISPSGSPISQESTVAVDVNVDEDLDIYTPLLSRIAHLIVIDILAIGVAQQKGEGLHEHLYKLKQGLVPLRV